MNLLKFLICIYDYLKNELTLSYLYIIILKIPFQWLFTWSCDAKSKVIQGLIPLYLFLLFFASILFVSWNILHARALWCCSFFYLYFLLSSFETSKICDTSLKKKRLKRRRRLTKRNKKSHLFTNVTKLKMRRRKKLEKWPAILPKKMRQKYYFLWTFLFNVLINIIL